MKRTRSVRPAASAAISEGNAVGSGVGLLGPLAVGAAVSIGWGWRPGVLVTAVLAVVVIVLVARVRRQQIAAPRDVAARMPRFVAHRAEEIRLERGGDGEPLAPLPERGEHFGDDVARLVGIVHDVRDDAAEGRPIRLEAAAKQPLVARADARDDLGLRQREHVVHPFG